MFCKSTRSRSRKLTPLAKWCTVFIILEFTSVGSGVISATSTSTTTTTTMATSSSSSSSDWSLLSTPQPTNPTGSAETSPAAITVPPHEPLPRFEALVQESPLGSKGKAFPLLGSSGLKEAGLPSLAPFQRPSDQQSVTISSSSTSSSSSSKYFTRKGSPSNSVDEASTASNTRSSNTNSTSLQGSPASKGSSATGEEHSRFSKITSANLILAEDAPAQKVPVGFTTSSSGGVVGGAGKTLGKTVSRANAVSSELEPSSGVNRLDTGGDTLAEVEGNVSKMYFETDNHTRIASQVGSIAVLPCAVRNIGEGVVSWIRRKDYHLLTIGFTTYSSDERFNIIHSDDTEEWPLQIKYVQLRDAGLYECQVSTHPPTSIFVKLDVVEAKAEIFGPSEKYLKPGSMLRLTCRVVQSNEPPLYIFWYHNSRMINYDTHRGVNVSTESDNRYSELVITHTNTLNSGNYSCVSNNAVAASTLVHILNGENPAAMQHGDHGNAVLLASHIHLPLAVVTYQVIIYVLRIC